MKSWLSWIFLPLTENEYSQYFQPNIDAKLIILSRLLFIYYIFLYYVIYCHINNTVYSNILKLIVYTIYVLLFVSEGPEC